MSATIRIVEPPSLDFWALLVPFLRRKLDTRVRIDFDGNPLGEGSYYRGVDLCVTTTPGTHDLEYHCDTPVVAPLRRKQNATVRLEIPAPGAYEYRLGLWSRAETVLRRVD
jgi:hypothetical protein